MATPTPKPRRRLAITKRVSLTGISEGWQDCYADVMPVTWQEFSDFGNADYSTMTLADQIKYAMDFVAAHFVSGKVMVHGEGLVDMTKDDIYASTDLSDLLFQEIVGLKLDPKASETAA